MRSNHGINFRLDAAPLGTTQGRFLNHNGTTYPGGESAILSPGQVGQEAWFTDAQAAAYTDPSGTITQLRGGRYQEILSKAASTIAPAAGQAAFWDGSLDNLGNYIVTPDNNNGIFVGWYISALAKGKYGFIQKSGPTRLLFTGTFTKTTPAIGDVVVIIPATGKHDVLADATAITWATLQTAVGKALEAPLVDTLKLVMVPDNLITI